MLEVRIKKLLGTEPHNQFRLDLDFVVDTGFTILTGKSGAGKSTTLRLIAGIVSPDEGLIKFESQIFFDSTGQINLSIQARRIAYVFQDYALFPHFTALQNIAYGIKSINRKVKIEKASEMLAQFHIEHLSRRRPAEMSGGEQQRVAVARALASDPAIVLLDEPLSAVDFETRLKLLDELELVQQKLAVPFIYVTHSETEVSRLSQRHLTIINGIIR